MTKSLILIIEDDRQLAKIFSMTLETIRISALREMVLCFMAKSAQTS